MGTIVDNLHIAGNLSADSMTLELVAKFTSSWGMETLHGVSGTFSNASGTLVVLPAPGGATSTALAWAPKTSISRGIASATGKSGREKSGGMTGTPLNPAAENENPPYEDRQAAPERIDRTR